jgi:regulation of enolase protein 1 (concanavalin A-like superfamily)
VQSKRNLHSHLFEFVQLVTNHCSFQTKAKVRVMTQTVRIATIPQTLHWETAPANFVQTADGALQMSALQMTSAPRTDFFIDPRGEIVMTNSARLLFMPDERFILSAHACCDLVDTYDAAVLMIYVDDRHWAKLCLERSPQGEPMIVSVVTNGVSDDCNSVVLVEAAAYLRVSGFGNAFALHYSLDGALWHFVRYFALQRSEGLRVGFSVQAPVGNGCTATFTAIEYAAAQLADLRSGV